MAVIGGFRSDLSITDGRLTEILETFPWVFCFPKSRINGNGGKLGSKINKRNTTKKEKAPF